MSLTASSLDNVIDRLAVGAAPGSIVLHVASDYPGSPVLHELIAHFSEKWLQRTCVYVPMRVTHEFLGQHEFEADCVPVLYSKDYTEFDRLFYHRKCSKILAAIRRQVELSGVGLVHAHTLFSAGGVALRLKRQFGIPYIVAVRNSDLNVYFKFGRHLRAFALDVLQNAAKVFFLSPSYREIVASRYVPTELRSTILAKSAVVPSGINDYWHEHLGNARPQPQHPLQLLYVGELTKNKNVESTIAVAVELNRRGIQAELTIHGTGRDERRIQRIAARHKRIVHLNGWVRSWPERLAIYRAADIFVMPSITETFGLVYIEAMSQGLPVIYTSGQGIDGYFQPGHVGFACEPKSISEMADRIEELVKTYATVSANAIAAVEMCRWNLVAEQYEQLYDHLVTDSSSPH